MLHGEYFNADTPGVFLIDVCALVMQRSMIVFFQCCTWMCSLCTRSIFIADTPRVFLMNKIALVVNKSYCL